MMEGCFFFDAAEQSVVDRALDAVRADSPAQHAFLVGALHRLERAAALVRDCPSIASSWSGPAGRPFSSDTLVERLCRVPDYDLDLNIPTKAVLGQAYLIAKINFFKALLYMLQSVDAHEDLSRSVEFEVGQSIYSKLAEELFVSIVTDKSATPSVKEGAAGLLFRIWEDRLLIEVDDFAPVLESAWHARSKLLPVLGTLLGTHEMLQLFREADDPRLLEYFGGDVEDEALLAFEEFLFGLSHEEIARLRAHMAEQGRGCVSLAEARALLGHADGPASSRGIHPAQALYTSYRKRRVNALHRELTRASGPKKTAEEYAMKAFLLVGAAGPGDGDGSA